MARFNQRLIDSLAKVKNRLVIGKFSIAFTIDVEGEMIYASWWHNGDIQFAGYSLDSNITLAGVKQELRVRTIREHKHVAEQQILRANVHRLRT
jgi:hypothetical protein